MTDELHDKESTTGLPRWVKVSVIVAVLLALLVVVVMLLSGGEHGPGRHVSFGAPAVVKSPFMGTSSSQVVTNRCAQLDERPKINKKRVLTASELREPASLSG